MTTILIISFLILAIIHFIYEGAIAPSMRLKLKYDLFVIRDQLRGLRESKPEEFSEEVYTYLQNSINNLIKFLPRINILTITRVEQKFNEDELLRQNVVKITRLLEDCISEDVQRIRSKIRRIFTFTIFVNNGMVMFYSLPVALLIFFAKAFVKRIVSAFQELLYIPEKEFCRVVPVQSQYRQY